MCKRGFYNVEKEAMEDMCPVDVPKAVDAAHTGFLEGDKSPTGHRQGGTYLGLAERVGEYLLCGTQRPYVLVRMVGISALCRTKHPPGGRKGKGHISLAGWP